MKTQILILVFFSFVLSFSNAQSCLPDGITLSTQQAIDSFAINYPGCTHIEGTLYISAFGLPDRIDSLTGLQQLQSIGGGLSIVRCPTLRSLKGLENIEETNNLYIHEVNGLSSLEGLEGLTVVNGSVEISENAALSSLQGLNQLEWIGVDLEILRNPALLSLEDLENLDSIGFEFRIEQNEALQSIGMNNLRRVEDQLRIHSNVTLGSIGGLNGLEVIGRDLFIVGNQMPTISGFNQLRHVEGNFQLEDNRFLEDITGFNLLERIEEDFIIDFNQRLASIEGFQQLKTISGNFEIKENHQLNSLRGLESLDTVNAQFIIFDNSSLPSLEGLNGLRYVGKQFAISSSNFSNLMGLENLSAVGGALSLFRNRRLKNFEGLSQLQSINRELDVQENDSLISLSGLDQLNTIGWNLMIQANPRLQSLQGLERLSQINGSLEIINNAALRSIEGLSGLNASLWDLQIKNNPDLNSLAGLEGVNRLRGLNALIENNASLTSLRGLDGLETIRGVFHLINNAGLITLEGLEQLQSIGDGMEITDHPALISLRGLDQLHTVGLRFRIIGNASLTSLNGLERLSSLGSANEQGHLYLEFNDQLESIASLGDIDLATIDYFYIRNNPTLSVCNAPVICNSILNNITTNIRSNAAGCNDRIEVLESCDGYSKVNFQVFYDLNQNKVRDVEEPLHHNASIEVNPGASIGFSINDRGGILFLEEGNYTFQYRPIPNWQLTTDSMEYHLTIDDVFSCDTLYFGIYPELEVSEMVAYIHSPSARCHEDISIDVYSYNWGSTITSGTLWLSLDPNVTPFGAVLADTFVPPNRYGWYFEDLLPGQTFLKSMRILIPGPPDFPVGDQLYFSAYTDYNDINGNGQSEIFESYPTVRCSYDPNDKLVSPDRSNHETLFEEALFYTIRFQNTGNDVAYDVVIRDTLDAQLDASTFRLLGTSHPRQLNTSLEADRYLTFSFRDIFLPDSTADLAGSQGYVSYTIRPIDGLPEQTVIQNTASIYFDKNPPIVTNTTENILVSELTSIFELAGMQIRLFPNPTSDQIHLQSTPDFEGWIQLNHLDGRLLMRQKAGEHTTIDLSQQPAGIYLLSLMTEDQQITQKVVKL